MRDVQKGRKSWLERLTSPPESEDDAFSQEPHPFERTFESGPPPPRESKVPDGYEAFAPPGLRPPPSDDLRSAPPERSGELTGPAFDTGQHSTFDTGQHPTFESGPRSEGGPQHAEGSGRGRLDPKPGDRNRPLLSPPAPVSHEAWKGPVPSPTRANDAPTPRSATGNRHQPVLPPSPTGPVSWQPEPTPLDRSDSSRSESSLVDLDLDEDLSLSADESMSGSELGSSSDLSLSGESSRTGELPRSGALPRPGDLAPTDALPRSSDLAAATEPSGPSESEQLEAARKRHVDELQHRWLVTQAQILDDPRDAVREAGLLIGDAMQFVTSTFTDHRDRIEREWRHNDSMSTDELRTVMRRYRNLFQYVLSASQLPDL